ncbi:MAG: 23S rRNA (guanosine(2251)-2'-O)-methyltransferase RlmB [Gemmatimonadota bacterium]
MTKGGSGKQQRPAGPGGRTKSGKPRPGTGGYGKRKLAGKGPTPPAHLRPGHPAQKRAARAASGRGEQREDTAAARTAGDYPERTARGQAGTARGSRGAGGPAAGPRAGAGPRGTGGARGAGDAPEVVAGRNAVVESLRAGVPATALYAGSRADADDRVREAIALAAQANIPMIEAGRAELDRLTGGAIHQGLALRLRPYDYAHPGDLIARARAAGEVPLIVALDGVTDPRNLGAIARSAAAFGGHGLLVPSRRSAGVTAGAWKASAGALAALPVAQAPNLARALASYQEAGLFVVGLDAAGDTAIGELAVADQPLVVVVGSEGRGLSRLTAQRCDVLARIPIASATESLNAGVAAGIALYEVAARRAAAS